MSKSQTKSRNPEATEIVNLLNSSKEIMADLEKLEREEEDDSSFFSRFNLSLVEGFGKEVKEKYQKVKVRFS